MKKNVIIQCNGFKLRKWTMRDIKSLAANADNRKVWVNVKDGFPSPYTINDAKIWVEMTRSFPANTNFAIDINGFACGGIGFHFFGDVHIHSAELGYWLGEKYWGKGICTEAVSCISKFIFDNFDINRIFARVFDWNVASMKVLEKNGFIREGRMRKHVFKNGVFTDEIIFGLLKDD